MKTRIVGLPKPSTGVALALVALFVALTGTATAAGLLITSKQIKDGTIQAVDLSNTAKASLRAGSGNSIEGAWKFTITRTEPGAPPPFSAYVTFSAGGVATEVNPLNQSTALGAWTKLSGHVYRYAVTRYRFNSAGTAVAIVKPLEDDTLSNDGNTIDGKSSVTVLDLDHHVIATGAATTHGERIRL